MTSDEENLESIPLQSRLSQIQKRTNSNRGLQQLSHSQSSISEYYCEEDIPSRSTPRLIHQTVLSICFALFGWYFPRYVIFKNAEHIGQGPIPYQKTSSGDVILDFQYNQPLIDPPTIPCELKIKELSQYHSRLIFDIVSIAASLLIWMSVWIPLMILVVCSLLNQSYLRRVHELHATFCGFIICIGLSELWTHSLKLYVQRRRPNFYALCEFSTQNLQCTTLSPARLLEANFSFPSGHSSLSCSSMTFLVWYFLGKLVGRTRPGAIFVCLMPWAWSVYVGASRIVDQWHHPSDVLAGLMLGFVAGTVAYHAWYPPVTGPQAGLPWSWICIVKGDNQRGDKSVRENGRLA